MKHYQSGATLIVALVLLAIVTLLGAAGIRSTSLEMKMIASSRDRAIAFEAAESTLRAVELNLIKYPPVVSAIKSNYNENCTGTGGILNETKGYCFGGTFDAADPYKTCEILSVGQSSPEYWNQKGYWDEAAGQLSVAVAEIGSEVKNITTKYMVEFMCFTLKDQSLLGTIDDKESGDQQLIYMPLFRITAIAEGLGGRAQAMTQAMVKVNEG